MIYVAKLTKRFSVDEASDSPCGRANYAGGRVWLRDRAKRRFEATDVLRGIEHTIEDGDTIEIDITVKRKARQLHGKAPKDEK